MKTLKKILLIVLIFIIAFISFRTYKISKYPKYKLDSDILYMNNDIYTFVQDEDIQVSSELDTIGIASEEFNKSIKDYIFPIYIKKVNTNMPGDFVMLSDIMWDGIFKKSSI